MVAGTAIRTLAIITTCCSAPQWPQVTKEEYASAGSLELGQQLLQQLRAQGKNPYLIPVGGSNALGTWGYIEAVEEVLQQSLAMGVEFTDIVVACGSGGTTAGVALGNSLSGMGARVHGFGVCDVSAGPAVAGV